MNAAIFPKKKNKKRTKSNDDNNKKTIFIAAVGCVTEADRKTAPFFGFFFCRSSFVVSRTCFYCFLTFWFRGIPPPLPQSIRPSKKAPRAFLKVALKPKKELFFLLDSATAEKKVKKNEVKPGNKSWIEFLILRETTSSPRSRPSRTEM